MSKGRAFFVVGHKNWGKSTTLKALTDDSRYPRRWTIDSVMLLVWREANFFW